MAEPAGGARPLTEGELEAMRVEIKRYLTEEYRTGMGLRCSHFARRPALAPIPRGSPGLGGGRGSTELGYADPTGREVVYREGPALAHPEDPGWWEPLRQTTVEVVHFVAAEEVAVFLAHECSRYCDLAIQACWVPLPPPRGPALTPGEYGDRIGRSERQVERYLQQGVDELGRWAYRDQRLRWPDEAIRRAR